MSSFNDESFIFICTNTVCVKNRNIYVITGSFTVYKFIHFGFFHMS